MLADIPVCLGKDYKAFMASTEDVFDKVLYTGMIDEYYEYCFGGVFFEG